ncbi:MAG TPA: serine/threonine-protein kinase, partial [Nannocystaceae bacterium]|nr:serine/threonine-protein kinase [Nannocystaceae bacterium]
MISDARTLQSGTQLGGYVIGPRIGRGGMAELYLARPYHVDAHRLVALKLVLPHLKDEPEFLGMFQREARVVASLRHPNIVGVLDCGFADGEAYIAMEYVHGRDLRGVLQRACTRGDRPLGATLAICVALCEALHHAHEQRGPDGRPLGLVHRDVSPGNVLVAFDGTVKLADFGIAKAFDNTHATGTGVIKGKLGYMSP